ncbi:MAG: AP2 domain-containing protein [Candidatus Sulfotelmatobacter sp.]
MSQYKSVTWDSARGLWRAYITIRNTLKFLGRFYDERDAALAYDAAARATFGEFAFCNFPLQEIAHLP